MTGAGARLPAMAAWLSHWRRHPWQAVTLVVGLALATGLWTGVQAINAEARAAYDRAAAVVAQGGHARVVARDGGAVRLEDYAALRRAGWPVAPVLEARARIGGRELSLIGLDVLSTPLPPTAAEAGGGDALAALIGPPGRVFAEPSTAEAVRGALAAEVTASADMAPGQLLGDIATIARLTGGDGAPSHLILLDPAPKAPPLATVAPALRTEAAPQDAGIGGLADSFHLNLTAFGLLAFAVGLFIVHGAMGLAFEQRRGTARTLRALGLPGRTLCLVAVAEAACVAILAGALGVAIGYAVAAVLMPGVAGTLRGLYGAPAPGDLALRAGWVAGGFAMATLGTAIATAGALVAMLRAPILDAARPRAWAALARRRVRAAALAGLFLATAALLLWAAGDGLAAGFALLAAGLGAAALLLPACLATLLRAGEAMARRPVAQWLWADARVHLPGLSLALMALMLAFAANVGVATMVGSFRTAFTAYLDQRLAADLYIAAPDAAEAERLLDWLAPRAEAVIPRRGADGLVGGRPGRVEALPDHPHLRANWPLRAALPGAWDRLAAGDGAFVSEQTAHAFDLRPGGTIGVAGTQMPVLAVYADYGATRPAAALSAAAFARAFPDVPATRFAVVARPGAQDALRTALVAEAGLAPDRVIDQGALKAGALSVFERTFAITGALNALTFGVAALALWTALATLSGQRLPHIAPLWAMGLTRRRLLALEVARTMALAALTLALALPVGLGLSWLLLAVVNVEAFGWRLPMALFPADYLRLAALALAVAAVAALLPARRILGGPPAALAKVFAHAL